MTNKIPFDIETQRTTDYAWFVTHSGRKFYLRDCIDGEFVETPPLAETGTRLRTLVYNVHADILFRMPIMLAATSPNEAFSEDEIAAFYTRLAPQALQQEIGRILARRPLKMH